VPYLSAGPALAFSPEFLFHRMCTIVNPPYCAPAGTAEGCGEDFYLENFGLMSGSSDPRIREVLKLRGGSRLSQFSKQYGHQNFSFEKNSNF
jgi:hypothetical protein